MSELSGRLATDQELLRTRAYADSGPLMARASIYAYKEPKIDFLDWALGHVQWWTGQRVLDVGCGPGQYLRRLGELEPRAVRFGVDLSEGMAVEARATGSSLAVASVQAIPLADGFADRVLAMHMLYHAPDIPAAAAELRRVLRPGGMLLAVTNGGDHLTSMMELVRDAAGLSALPRFMERFTLEDGGADLSTAFDHVVVDRIQGELIVPDVEPVMAYVGSMRALAEPQLPDGTAWDDVVVEARARVADEIARSGAWRCPTDSGLFVCH